MTNPETPPPPPEDPDLSEANFCRIFFDGIFEKALTEDGIVLDKAGCDKVSKKHFRVLVAAMIDPLLTFFEMMKERDMLDDWKYNHLVSSLRDLRETTTDLQATMDEIMSLTSEYLN